MKQFTVSARAESADLGGRKIRPMQLHLHGGAALGGRATAMGLFVCRRLSVILSMSAQLLRISGSGRLSIEWSHARSKLFVGSRWALDRLQSLN